MNRTFLRAMETVMTGHDALDLATSSTFFVPTDAAFEELGAATVENAMKNADHLRTVRGLSFGSNGHWQMAFGRIILL